MAPVHQGPGASTLHAVQGAPNAALLIDFDNVTLGIRSDLQTELRNLLSSAIVKGKVAVQRAYADWRRYPQYIVPLSESSIDLIFAPAYGSSKKNATDIRLAVDAIELVFTRPEIGTFILLSGDSDFSSMVLKLKEYGKYVIGVGIRESSSDLLVQNCDEYYSYNALAGLAKVGDEENVRKDPWELVVESVERMKTNGDVMRADRLKQVMQDIDPSFDEGNLGMAKFSKFCLEAAQRGLLKVTKLDNGQLEVAPADHAGGRAAATPAAPASEPRERGSRGGRGGRGRRGRRGPADETAPATSATSIAEAPVASAAVASAAVAPASGEAEHFGRSGERLSREEAFTLIRRALTELSPDGTPVDSDAIRQRMHQLLGRDSESLTIRHFHRIIRDAHDASIIDARKRGDTYELSPAATALSVADQLSLAAAAAKTANGDVAAPPAPRSITARRPGRGKAAAPPPDLLSVGVVELDEPAKSEPVDAGAETESEPDADAATPRPKRRTRRGGRGRKRAAPPPAE